MADVNYGLCNAWESSYVSHAAESSQRGVWLTAFFGFLDVDFGGHRVGEALVIDFSVAGLW